MNDWKHVYVLLSENGNVKIGVSKNVMKRIKAIEGASGYKICDFFITEKCSNAYEIENELHKTFSGKKLYGEWFYIDFKKAIKETREVYERLSEFTYEKESESTKTIEFLKSLYGTVPLENGFLEEFMEMAIELGEKMKIIKELRSKL